MQNNSSLCSENILFDLFSGFIDVTISVSSQKSRILAQWDHFKKLIMAKPIDYHQVYSFISKLTVEADYCPKDNNSTPKDIQSNDYQQNQSQSSAQSTNAASINNSINNKNQQEQQQQIQQQRDYMTQQNKTTSLERNECFDDIIDNQTTVQNKQSTQQNGNQQTSLQQIQSQDDNNYKNLYVIQKFSDFVRKSCLFTTPFSKITQNSQYMSSYVIELQNQNNSLLKYVAIYHFKQLLTENYNDHQKNPLYEIFLAVQNKKIKLGNCVSAYTSDQLFNSFSKNFALLLHQKLVLNLSNQKIAKNFLYQVCTDPVYLHALINTLKEIMVEFVETCDNETLTSFVHSTSQNEQEKRTKLVQNIRQNWKEVKQEWFFLLTMAINRAIEIHIVKDNKLEKTIFSCKTKTHQRTTSQNEDRYNNPNNNNSQNKINLLQLSNNTQAVSSSSSLSNNSQINSDSKTLNYYLLINISEVEIYENINSKFDTYISDDVNIDQIITVLTQQATLTKKQDDKDQQKDLNNNNQSIQSNNMISSSENPLQKVSRLALNLVNQNSSNTFLNNLSNISNTNQLGQQQAIQFHQQQQQQQQQSEDVKKLRGAACTANSPRLLSMNPPTSSYSFGIQGGANINQTNTATSIDNGSSKNANNQYKFGVQNKLSYFENPSPKYNFTTQLQKSSMNSSSKQIQDEWNRNLILSKAKELLFMLNIDSDKLNSVVKFNQGNSSNSSAKENFNSRSPLKYKQVLYPMKGGVSSDAKKHVSMLSAQQLQTQI